MGNGAKIALASVVCVVLLIVIYICTSISYKNKEVRLRNLVKMKQEDNKNQNDVTWKKISQAAQVTDAQKQALLEIVTGYAKARDNGGGGTLAKAITEAVPNVDTSTFNNLQNIITAARDSFARNQTELIDYKREHDILLDSPVSGWFLSGCQHLEITVVTSTRTAKTFETGKDDEVELRKVEK